MSTKEYIFSRSDDLYGQLENDDVLRNSSHARFELPHQLGTLH